MYLLSAETEIDWVLGITPTVIALADLDLLFIDPEGTSTYVDAPIDISRFTAPTVSVPGSASYLFTPEIEGLWKIRLVIGTSASYRVISKVEMYVIDNTTVVNPFSTQIGVPIPYDIAYFLQGYTVPAEMVGSYIATRDIAFGQDDERNMARATVAPNLVDQVFQIKYQGVQVGTITFVIGSFVGVVLLDALLMLPSQVLQIFTAPAFDQAIKDVSITLVGCSNVSSCDLL